ncbi:MAG: hypothetical protein HZA61_14000 [Candidatus Eisenbacteria bacterium]|uniref:Doubled CXXCH motif domain-containing protein n=1 Tax=Eiseniibacteriota bacterium TaxID=2212470 RepID=A0A933SDJ7_UNCEI|nr:hypothetical protein [Candidatus Eisenbacteria bacterium]
MSRPRAIAALAAAGILVTAAVLAGGLGEPGSNAHNLSAGGPGAVHAQSAAETQTCVFCHTPHNANPSQELWNHAPTAANYTVYGSSTLNAGTVVLQPSGASRLCLSCHDGTIAVGATRTHGTIAMTGVDGGGRLPASSGSNLGGGGVTPDLSDDHPVSFIPVLTAEIVAPPPGQPVQFDAGGQLQCTSCHDPHNDSHDGNPGGLRKFLVTSNASSAMCRTCHAKQFWNSVPTTHATSTRTWNGLGTNPFHTGYPNVAQNGCESCHRTHSAPGAKRLLKGQDPANAARRGEEWTCVPCHNGNAAAYNVTSEFQKAYVHPSFTTTPSVHDPTESPSNGTFPLPETNAAAPRHAECVDCHNPHASSGGASTAPATPPSMREVSGVTRAGAATASATYEYEVCLKCHGSSANKPQASGGPYGPYTRRQNQQFNAMTDFQTTNPSFHPVFGARNSAEVPSLIAPYTASSVVTCTDCHNNDSGTNAGGAGPKGPHGSQWKRLLERRYELTDGTTESAQVYALCYKCHSRTSILSDATFGEHSKHVVSERTSCTTCHDPHGTTGSATNYSHLVNFNLNEVTAVPGVANTPRYEDTGAYNGRCYLVCHGKSHNPLSY